MISFKEISIGDIILLLTAIVLIWYSWETRGMRKEMVNQNEKFARQLKLQTFSDYTKRYQEIILNLPEKINERQFDIKELPPDRYERTMRYLRAYFDLCAEEYWLHERGLIDEEWWKIWKYGMATAFNRPPFRNAWELVKHDTSFGSEFINFVHRELIA